MDFAGLWDQKHPKYAQQDWINKPTIFAQFALRYFPKTGKLVDLGAGQGQDSRFFAKQGFEVTSTDFSPKALELSQEKADKENVTIKLGNVDLSAKLPFANSSFDVVYSHLALHYFDDQTTRQLFDEIFRITKPGGVFAALMNTMQDPEVAVGEKIEEGLYKVDGILKRYFTPEYLTELITNKFEIVVLDEKGETYKDKIKTLVRFVGRKI